MTRVRRRYIILSRKQLKALATKWVDYFIDHPQKLFRSDEAFPDVATAIEYLKSGKGFQLTAFAGKIQTDYTNPDRLPDLGEFNLLARIRAIQVLTELPLRIVFDGKYYADLFGENETKIPAYEEKIRRFANLIELNKEFPGTKRFYTVLGLQRSFGDHFSIANEIKRLRKHPDEAMKATAMSPETFEKSVRMFISKHQRAKYEDPEKLKKIIQEKSTDFIIYKAALATLLKKIREKDHYRRITILKYKKCDYPRINMEMNMAPWNSAILFKKKYLNINTTTNGKFVDFFHDSRSIEIKDWNDEHLGFTRNECIFEDL